jgi:hypothetical protein
VFSNIQPFGRHATIQLFFLTTRTLFSAIAFYARGAFENDLHNPRLIFPRNKFKVGKVKVNFSLEQAMKAQKGSRGVALLFL